VVLNFLGLSINQNKIKFFALFISIILTALFVRSFYLQAVQGSYYHQLAEGNRIRVLPIKASRGVVFDAKGKQLVQKHS